MALLCAILWLVESVTEASNECQRLVVLEVEVWADYHD